MWLGVDWLKLAAVRGCGSFGGGGPAGPVVWWWPPWTVAVHLTECVDVGCSAAVVCVAYVFTDLICFQVVRKAMYRRRSFSGS